MTQNIWVGSLVFACSHLLDGINGLLKWISTTTSHIIYGLQVATAVYFGIIFVQIKYI